MERIEAELTIPGRGAPIRDAVDADPLIDLKLLAEPARIIGVWRSGRRVKG